MPEPESYRPAEVGSSPAPPALSPQQPDRFQFHLKHLLAFMFASSLVAFGLRHLVLYLKDAPLREQAGVVNTTVAGIAFGGLLYFFLRVPFLAVKANRFRHRWLEIKRHRRELAAWSAQQQKRARLRAEDSESSPPLS
jgi:hypothetical protein